MQPGRRVGGASGSTWHSPYCESWVVVFQAVPFVPETRQEWMVGGGGIRRVRHWRRVGVAMGPSNVYVYSQSVPGGCAVRAACGSGRLGAGAAAPFTNLISPFTIV